MPQFQICAPEERFDLSHVRLVIPNLNHPNIAMSRIIINPSKCLLLLDLGGEVALRDLLVVAEPNRACHLLSSALREQTKRIADNFCSTQDVLHSAEPWR